jgi:uncharacterized protein YjbI with pentapeptide repeats
MFSQENTDIVKTIGESAKAALELGKAIKENRKDLESLQPHLYQISSLLDLLNNPLGQVLKEAIPFSGLAMTLLHLASKNLQQELVLEECLLLVLQAAYLESLQQELQHHSLVLDSRFTREVEASMSQLGEYSLDKFTAKEIISDLPSSDLFQIFNIFLIERLKNSRVDLDVASRLAERVAWKTPRHFHLILAENAKEMTVLSELFKLGGKADADHYSSVDRYIKEVIQPLPDTKIFDLTLREIYVPLKIKLLNQDGSLVLDQEKFISIHEWARQEIKKPESRKILFIQGEAGRGKSAFCRMFTEVITKELAFIPIFVRLRDLRHLESTFSGTIEKYLETFDFTKDNHWLTSRNERFLFILDGFDELLLERRSKGLKELLGQIENFQRTSHHRIIITGRPLAMQGVESVAFTSNNCLERVELQLMDDDLCYQWFNKWANKFGKQESQDFEGFLKSCPADIQYNLAREPLLLYILGRMHYKKAICATDLEGKKGLKAKAKVYDKTVEWVLGEQRNNINQRIFNNQLNIVELRRLLTEVAVCIMQSGNENASLESIKFRLKAYDNDTLQKLFSTQLNEQDVENDIVNNLLTTFYIQSSSKDREGSVEFVHKSFGEFLFAERIKEAFVDWSDIITDKRRGTESLKVDDVKMNWQVYDLLSCDFITLEITNYLKGMLEENNDWSPVDIFIRLDKFWQKWCNGVFIDEPQKNLPQEKMRILHEQKISRASGLGIRQIDVHTGMNILILLLELHRYSQDIERLKDKISFHPNGILSSYNFNYLLQVFNYAESISQDTLKKITLFLSRCDLKRANLSGVNLSEANLSGANLSEANLSGANLSKANLGSANLKKANLSGANLSGVNLSEANLSGANLSGVNLSEANLSGANLSGVNLSEANLGSANLSGVNLSEANLRKANLWKTDLRKANLRKANLWKADLGGANLGGAYLVESHLRDVDFSGSDLSKADLSIANLSAANLSGVNLKKASLIGADLSAAKLTEADLSETYLIRANLNGANLIGVKWSESTNWKEVQGITNTQISLDLQKYLEKYLVLKLE